ncbi:MAG: CvpA family protein [Blautia sp.]
MAVEIVAAVILLLSVWNGWQQGLLMKVYHIVRFILRLILSLILLPLILPALPESVTARQGVAFLAAWIIASIVIGIRSPNFSMFVQKLPVVSTLNKAGGAVLGLVLGVAVLWILLLLIGAFQDNGWCGQIADMVKQLADETK